MSHNRCSVPDSDVTQQVKCIWLRCHTIGAVHLTQVSHNRWSVLTQMSHNRCSVLTQMSQNRCSVPDSDVTQQVKCIWLRCHTTGEAYLTEMSHNRWSISDSDVTQQVGVPDSHSRWSISDSDVTQQVKHIWLRCHTTGEAHLTQIWLRCHTTGEVYLTLMSHNRCILAMQLQSSKWIQHHLIHLTLSY